MRLINKTALVTGSTSNIGKAIAIRLAAEGAFVIVSGRDTDRGEAVVARIRAEGGSAEFISADLDGSPETSVALAEAAIGILDRIDILVNNAGIFPAGASTGIDEETYDRIWAVNVKAPFFLTSAVAPAMVERGNGVIVNMGSWIARLAVPGAAVYSATKGAMETITRSWAAEYGPSGVRVNAVSPGVIRETAPVIADRGESMMHGTPANRSGRPTAIAEAVLYLASDESSFVHGITLDVDGGRTTVAVSR